MRKFQTGDKVKVTKLGRYGKREGTSGIVEDYQLRLYRGGTYVGGSHYRVNFGDNIIWVETEYLTKV